MSWRLLGMLDDVECASPTAKLILVKLVDRADDDGRNIYPSIARIAAFAGCSERQTKRVMAAFCAVGLLRIVKEGGKGPGSTRHYELSIDMLRRMASETWDAIVGRHAQDACADDDEGVDSASAKGDTMSPLEPVRVTSATSKGDTHVTQPLRGTLKPEREGAHERGQGPSPDSDAPDAGHAADAVEASEGLATLAEFRAAYPHCGGDDLAAVASAWAAVAFDQRRAAIDGIPGFLAERKAAGFSKRLSAPKYLIGENWKLVPAQSAERAGKASASAVAMISAWSRDWWLILFDKCRRGERPGFHVQRAEAGQPVSLTEGDLAAMRARIGDLQPFRCDGPELDAWRDWLCRRGARIGVLKGDFRVFLPAALPPDGKREEGDDDVRL